MAAAAGPNVCNNLSKKEALVHLQDIFAVNSALETLLTLSQDTTSPSPDLSPTNSPAPASSDSDYRLATTTFHPTTIVSPDDSFQKGIFPDRIATTTSTTSDRQPFQLGGHALRPTSFGNIGSQRISTIYKSNEALYFEDVAHDHDFNCGVISPSAPTVECLRTFDVLATSSSVPTSLRREQRRRLIESVTTVSEPSSISPVASLATVGSVSSLRSQISHLGSGEGDTVVCELRDHLSPDSDRSIEADASESVDLDRAGERQHKSLLEQSKMSGRQGGWAKGGGGGNNIRTSYGTLSPEIQAIINKTMTPQQREAFYAGQSATNNSHHPKQDKPNHHQPHIPHPAKQNSNKGTGLLPNPAKQNSYNKGAGLLPNPANKRPSPVHMATHPPAPAPVKRLTPQEIAVNKIQSGARVLIILRGVPGSGKSTLARQLLSLEGASASGLVLSTDDHFQRGGVYRFVPEQLPAAHARTQAMAIRAMQRKRSPVIIDNTNTQAWEMVPYVAAGLLYGYFFWLMQPDTHWRYDAVELARRNTHGVRLDSIQRMLDRFDRTLGSERLKQLALEHLQEKGLATKLPPQGGSNPARSTASPVPGQTKRAPARSRSRPGHAPRPIPSAANPNSFQPPHHVIPNKPLQAQTTKPRLQSSGKDLERGQGRHRISQNYLGIVQVGSTVNLPNGEADGGGGSSQSALDWTDVQDGETWSLSTSPASSDDDYSDCGSTQSSNIHGPLHQDGTSLHKSKSVPNLAGGKSDDPTSIHQRRSRPHTRAALPPPDEQEQREIDLMVMDHLDGSGPHLLDGVEDWDGLGDATALMDAWRPLLSDNMKDLLTIDFSQPAEESSSATSVTSISTSPTTTTDDPNFTVDSVEERPVADTSKPDESLFRQLKLSLNPNWDMPAYPGSPSVELTDTASKYNVFAELSKPQAAKVSLSTPSPPVISSDDDPSASAAPDSDAAGLPRRDDGDGDGVTTSQSRENHLNALKAFFGNISVVDLTDIFDTCNGDIQWTVNTLLDAGYEMNSSPVVSIPAAGEGADDGSGNVGRPPKSESSLEGLAELTLDDDRFEVLSESNDAIRGAVRREPVSGSTETIDRLPPPPSLTSSSSWTSEATGVVRVGEVGAGAKPEDVTMRMDPFFAMQLERMFGPVGFHLEPACYSGDDLKVTISMELARRIHSSWDKSLQDKFQSEESELKSMTTDEDFAHQMQATEDTGSTIIIESDPRGEHFPQLEKQKLIDLLQQKEMPNKTENIASKIKRRQLYDMFPKIDPKSLDQVFEANEGSFSDTVIAIQDSYQPDEKPRLVIAPSQLEEYENSLVKLALQESLALELERTKGACKGSGGASQETSYDDLRAEASIHYYLRQEFFQKAREAYGNNMRSVASYYSQQGHAHTQKLNEANAKAAKKILEVRNAGRSSKELDLHSLHVPEAMQALVSFMEEKRRELRSGSNPRMTVYIITGRGNHSAMGVPRIKPAVIDYLAKHNYSYNEPHGGLIEVTLTKLQSAV